MGCNDKISFCKRMTEDKLSLDICSLLDNDDRVAKDILHVTRAEFTEWLWAIPHKITMSTQFALFLINRKKLIMILSYKQNQNRYE